MSPIPTVSPGNVSLAASTSEAARKEGELPSAGQVPEASLVSTWRLCVPICPLDAQHLLPWNAHFYCFPMLPGAGTLPRPLSAYCLESK